MAERSSFPSVAEQIITFNKNVVDTLNNINALTTTQDPSVSIQIIDDQGVLREYSLPSFSFLSSEINRLNNNINSLYNIDDAGALIQTSSQNQYKKIITVDLNTQPNTVGQLSTLTSFVTAANSFFDGLIDPKLQVEIDLSNKIDNSVKQCLSRRYIIDFGIDASGNLTPLGQSALNSFNSLFRNQSNISIDEFTNWLQTTPGVNGTNPNIDEQIFNLDPNQLLYDGLFTVLKTEEDTINRILWYHIDTLDYVVTGTNEIKQLAAGDQLILNSSQATTIYQIIQISTAATDFRIQLQRYQGTQPVAVGVGTLKIYSPVVYTKKLRITIGYNERNVIFIKPINTDTNLIANDWSLGTGFWTNDLNLVSNDANNWKSMQQFYIYTALDYGVVLKDLVAKKIPNTLGATPVAPSLVTTNFKVIQTNTHLTDTPDSNLIKVKHNQSKNLKSQVQQLNDSIQSKQTQLKTTRLTSDAAKAQINNEIDQLTKTKNSKSTLLTSTVNDIITLSKSTKVNIAPEFALRGFWPIPQPTVAVGTNPQQVVQFRVQYRRLSKDGKETPVTTFQITDNNATPSASTGRLAAPTPAAFSNWIEYKTDSLQRTLNPATGVYTWVVPSSSDSSTPNINQISIPIKPNETIEFRVKSISEVGWPESPLESDWADSIQYTFPDDLVNVLTDNTSILDDANKEDLKTSVQADLTSKGLDDLLSKKTVTNNKTYFLPSDGILSGFQDSNGNALDLYDYLVSLQTRITALEEAIKKSKGILEVTIFRNNQQFVVKNNSEVTFTVECEDYLDPFTGAGVPTGRVYANNIYVIKDFLLKVDNGSVDSPLGLLSNRTYTNDSDVYNTSTPQVFWVDNQNELISSSVTGQTFTQLDNQFIWMTNFDTINQTTITKLSEDIGNSFVTSNSITDVTGSTEFNVGYNQTSILQFIGNNNSLLDVSKWIDDTVSVASTTKLLTTIHPSVTDLTNIVQTNSDKVETIDGGDSNAINIPLNIYFKMNALDTTQTGVNYQYINLNSANQTVRHVKKLKFFLENQAENRPFVFTVTFNINRNKIAIKKNLSSSATPQVLG